MRPSGSLGQGLARQVNPELFLELPPRIGKLQGLGLRTWQRIFAGRGTISGRGPLASPFRMSAKSHPPVPEASETEWLLLSCIWDLRSANPIEVAEHLGTRYKRELSAKTVGILLGRLVEKGFLRSVTGPVPPRGRPALIYFPLVSRQDALRRQFQRFVEAHLIQDEDIALLEVLLAERKPH
jgi:predicted transcriptional regulator